MIKDIIANNENVTPNEKQIQALREYFPACFHNGEFDLERFKEYLGDSIINHEGYELRFLGKNYARLLASIDTTTVVVPDEEHNAKPENVNSQNVYITGDNLDGLKHLLKSYYKQVKCIYIDPPYNTGSDGFVYNDTFNFTADDLVLKLSISEEQAARILTLTKKGSASHSAWLMFMYPRLLLARDLLDTDGVIFISVDDNEQANLKLICDDVFGEENFLTCISRATGTPTGGGFDGLVNELDYVLIYSKNKEKTIINGLEMNSNDAEIYDKVDENGNRYLIRSLRRTGGEDRREDRPTMFFPLIAPDGTEIYPYGPSGYESRWICASAKAKWLEENNLLEWNKIKKNGEMIWHPFQKYYLENRTKTPGNIWLDLLEDEDLQSQLWDKIEGNKKATREIRDLFDGKKVFETAKPVDLLLKIITIALKEESLILDFFSGSATTAHAVIQRNIIQHKKCKFIMVQLDEPVKKGSDAENAGYKTIDQIGKERIIRAAQKLENDYPEKAKECDLGFKSYFLRTLSQQTLDKIEKFSPNDNGLLANDMLGEFGLSTVLATWLVRDGYGLTSTPEKVKFADYEAYYIGKHLYLITQGLSKEAIDALLVRYETDGNFNPENIVLFGYSFTWTELETLTTNLKRLKDIKNLHITPDIRY